MPASSTTKKWLKRTNRHIMPGYKNLVLTELKTKNARLGDIPLRRCRGAPQGFLALFRAREPLSSGLTHRIGSRPHRIFEARAPFCRAFHPPTPMGKSRTHDIPGRQNRPPLTRPRAPPQNGRPSFPLPAVLPPPTPRHSPQHPPPPPPPRGSTPPQIGVRSGLPPA